MTTRDPIYWPYPPESIWNMPLGDAKVLVDAQFVIPTTKTVGPEEDTFLIDPDAPLVDLLKHDGGWKPTPPIRCEQILDPLVIMATLPTPEGWATDPDYYGDRPNMAAAFVRYNDEGELETYETAPMHICEGSYQPISQYHNVSRSEGPGTNLKTGGMRNGDGHGGNHGGSGMSCYGGAIRLGEWVPGSTITHVLKLVISGWDNFYGEAATGYRWPAWTQDSGWPEEYTGTVPEFLMGCLLCLDTDFDVSALKTEPGRIFAQAMQHYGGYTVDSSGTSSLFQPCIERGPQGRVMDEFEGVWGYPMDGRKWDITPDTPQWNYLDDMEIIMANLYIVDDNGPGNVGGAGNRLTAMAPGFDDEEPPITPGTGTWKVWNGTEWIGGTMNMYDGEGWIQ